MEIEMEVPYLPLRVNLKSICKESTHFNRIREEGGSGPPPPTVNLRTDNVT